MEAPSLIRKIRENAMTHGDNIALINPNSYPKKLTYRELFCKAVILSEYLLLHQQDANPIIVYGHKNPYMIVSFLACVMAGRAYCPIDTSIPENRVATIIGQLNSSLVLSTEVCTNSNTKRIDLHEIINICDVCYSTLPEIPITTISSSQTFYVIFTSGSTGTPKGVEISFESLNNFLQWSSTLGEEAVYGKNSIFLNQAPFSFDLSVMDLYTSLYCGSTLCMMDKKIQTNFAAITPFIISNGITAIVSTPSFINICLVDKQFTAKSIPKLRSFFFCGEVLTNKSAAKLTQRFPNAVIQNTYGPTESTVAVTSVRITREILNEYNPLPVGRPKPNVEILISEYEEQLVQGQRAGEVLIIGDTLAKGYFGRTDLTSLAFIQVNIHGQNVRAYRTGDLGYLQLGQLFYCGRIDLQIKLNGYRIEIGEIESCILTCNFVDSCVVLPRIRNDRVISLVGVIVLNNSSISHEEAKSNIMQTIEKLLPAYMIPHRFAFIDALPMTSNGKADRIELSKFIEEI